MTQLTLIFELNRLQKARKLFSLSALHPECLSKLKINSFGQGIL